MARMAKGYKSKLALGFEETYGVMPDSPKGYDMPFNSYGVSLSRSLNAAETISGTRNPKEPFAGNTDVSGDIVVPVDLIAFGYWLRGLFGVPTTTPGEESAPNTHLFKINDDLESMWIQTYLATSPGNYVLTNGVKISSMAIEAGGDGELTATLSTMGSNQVLGAESKAGELTPVSFLRLNNFQASLKLDGVDYGDATAFSLNLDNGLDGDVYTIGRGGTPDGYMVLADFASYCDVQKKVDEVYRDRERWNRMSLINIAKAGFFAADRAVKEYADRIWGVHRIK